MSTAGVLILRRDKAEKGIKIRYDAYPAGAGEDIVDLIKTADVNALYDLIKEYDESECLEKEIQSDEMDSFSYDSCRHAIAKRKYLWVSSQTKDDIKNSLFCECAYVIDLDRKCLFLYKGLQTQPTEHNPYGVAPVQNAFMTQPYYPCRPVAEVSLGVVRESDTDFIVNAMERAFQEEDYSEIRSCKADGISDTGKMPGRWEEKLLWLKAGITDLRKRLCYIERTLPDLNPVSEKRYRELQQRYVEVKLSVKKLEEQIELIK